jgi:hypothetical protein
VAGTQVVTRAAPAGGWARSFSSSDGNHENHPLLLSHPVRFDGLRVLRPRLYHLSRGFRWCWHGKTWLAVGGAHSIARPRLTPNVDWSPQELITADHARLATAGALVDIMVTHDCPAGVKPPGIRDPAIGQPSELYDELVVEAEHRQLVREIVEEVRPARLIHGHYHVRHDAHLQLRVGTTWCITVWAGLTPSRATCSCSISAMAEEPNEPPAPITPMIARYSTRSPVHRKQ